MNIWTVANLKGGVGKTTTALTLAGLAASRGSRVVLVDLDPHCSLSSYFLRNRQNYDYSSYNFFSEQGRLNPFSLKKCIQNTEQDNLGLIPASPALASLDRQPVGQDGAGLMVAAALSHAQSMADLVIIDGPPMAGVLMVNAIVACNQLVIPVQTDYLGVQGLRRMLATLKLIGDSGHQKQARSLIVPTLFDRRTHASNAALEELREEFGDNVWGSQIAIDTKFREASALGQLPHKLQLECCGVNAYRLLLDNLLQQQTPNSATSQADKSSGSAL